MIVASCSGGNFRSAAPIFRDVRIARRRDQRFVTQDLAMQIAPAAPRKSRVRAPAVRRGTSAILRACVSPVRNHYSRAGIVQDVCQPVGRLVEINWHAYRAQSLNREIRDVPFRAIRREDAPRDRPP